jgi:hypothetical protein
VKSRLRKTDSSGSFCNPLREGKMTLAGMVPSGSISEKRRLFMRLNIMAVTALLAGLAYAKEPKPHNSGTLLQMDSVQCGTAEKTAKSFAGELLGTDSGHKNTQQVLCQEYVLQTDRVVYRIRPRDEKHPALLPVGQSAQFYMEKDRMRLRVEDLDDKERDYTVVSMTPRDSNKSAVAGVPVPNRN